jgi:ABC-type branched-subunit amino acid transport system substrate-binding protein
MDGQARAMVNFASRKSPDQKAGLLIVYPEADAAAGLMEAIKDQCGKNSCGPVLTERYQRAGFDARTLAGKLFQTGKQTVFFLGTSAEALALMLEADKLRWSPLIYFPVTTAGKEMFDAPLSFDRKIFTSFPTSPGDQTKEGIEEFRALATKYKLPAHHLAVQISVYSAAKILVEGLKRTGKDLSREKLVETLEGFNEFATGLTPPVTFGPNRRIGATGAYVVTLDLEKKVFMPVSSWVSTN